MERASALLAWPGFAHGQDARPDGLPVEGLHGCAGRFGANHRDESESGSLWLSAINSESNLRDIAVSRKDLLQFVRGGGSGKIIKVDPGVHSSHGSAYKGEDGLGCRRKLRRAR